MSTPDAKKREALKKAWQMRWKKQKKTNPDLKENTINPSWLKVEYAMIFFKSHSWTATIPAIVAVNRDNTIKKNEKLNSKTLKRTSKYTPAVTSVEEWTSDETGVGAAIAAGNQEEKGICALLVINVKIKRTGKIEK